MDAMLRWFLVCLTAILISCSSGTPDVSRRCSSNGDCINGNCVDGVCVDRDAGAGDGAVDTGREDAEACEAERVCGLNCCADGEECVDGFQCLPVCDTVRCGDNNGLCCGAEEICLDGVVCAAACEARETLCGSSLELCCPAGDVCLDDACATPGIECADDFDCRDASLYCEPTLGQCLPTPTGDVCEVAPEFEEIEVTPEWHFDGVTVGGRAYTNIIQAPVVGDVSGDGVPDVVVSVYSGTTWREPVLVALDGADGSTHFVIDRSAPAPDSEGIALANFDDDDALEIVYRVVGGGIRLVDGDGTTELGLRTLSGTRRGTLEVADINQDGVPDIVAGCTVYNGRDISDSAMDIFDAARCAAGGWESPVVADLDGDGRPEITNGALAYNHDGTELWSGGRGGLVAIADLDVDGQPEIVSVDGGTIVILDGATGDTLVGPGGTWHDGTFSIPGGGNGGSPTVADFDGDGLPEIATAGRGNYVVYDLDCFEEPIRAGGDDCDGTEFLRWAVPTQDISSSVTGSSVFDFQGDGVAEVIYNDECFLHIYDGRDGRELLTDPIPNSSRTGYEYPIVVDVDADGNSEIVVVANSDQAVRRDNCPAAYAAAFGVPVGELPEEYASGTNGVYVFGDAFDRWVPTRPIWNQFSYHVSNVSPTGEVPMSEVDNWTAEGLNNYRQNVQGRGVFNAPNLQVDLETAGVCAENSVRLSAVVRNVGSRGVAPGVVVEFVRTDTDPEERVAMEMTTGPLLPGGSERVTVVASGLPTDTDVTFEVRVNGESADRVTECIDDDNADTGSENCPGLL